MSRECECWIEWRAGVCMRLCLLVERELYMCVSVHRYPDMYQYRATREAEAAVEGKSRTDKEASLRRGRPPGFGKGSVFAQQLCQWGMDFAIAALLRDTLRIPDSSFPPLSAV